MQYYYEHEYDSCPFSAKNESIEGQKQVSCSADITSAAHFIEREDAHLTFDDDER